MIDDDKRTVFCVGKPTVAEPSVPAFTPGAMRAAELISMGFEVCVESDLATIISRETGDRDMYEALQLVIEGKRITVPETI